MKWENLGANQHFATFKRVLFFLLVVLISLTLLTPTYAINMLDPLKYTLSKLVVRVSFLTQMIATYFTPLIIIFINFVIIPSLVDFSVLFEDHQRESNIQISIIWRIFFFMLLNTLLIPITEASTAQVFFQKLEAKHLEEWPTLLSGNMMTQQYVFIKFIVQLTFITNGLSLIDAPHRIVHWIQKKYHNYRQRDSLYKEPCIDDYQFDLGYNQSYCLVIFLNCLLFSTMVPIIPFFACLYFSIKHRVDKYNLVFTYYRKYESGGRIKNSVRQFMLFNLGLYAAVMICFFGYKYPRTAYYWVGIIFAVLWTAAFWYARKHWHTDQVQATLAGISKTLGTSHAAPRRAADCHAADPMADNDAAERLIGKDDN